MLIYIYRDFLFGNWFVVMAYKNRAWRYFVAVLCAITLLSMSQTVVAEPEEVKAGTAQTEVAQSGVAPTQATPMEVVPAQATLTEAAPTPAAPTEVAPAQVAPAEAIPTQAASTEAASTEVVPTQATPTKVAPTPAAPTEAAPAPAAIIPAGAVQAVVAPTGTAPAETAPAQAAQKEAAPTPAVSPDAAHAQVAPAEAVQDLALKKKVVIVQFDVAKKIQVDDISNIYDGLPTLLSSRLPASGKFLSVYDRHTIPLETGTSQREAIIQIARVSGAQFLISGMVVDAGISLEKWSLFGGNKRRHLEVELAVYDGHDGTQMLLRRFGETIWGDLMVGNNKPFGSIVFFETEFGRATSRLVDSAVKEIQGALENIPFSANIIRVDGKRAFLDAGSDSLLKPGDKIVAYVSDARNPISGLNGSVFGAADRAADTITLTQVKPQFSIGELSEDAAKLGIRAGNIARINAADQRDLAAKQIAAQQLAKTQQGAKPAKGVKTAQAGAAQTKAKKKSKAAKLKPQQEVKTAQVSATPQDQAKTDANAAKLKERQEAKADLCKRLAALQSACEDKPQIVNPDKNAAAGEKPPVQVQEKLAPR